MATVSGIPERPQDSSLSRPISDGWSYIYVGLWNIWYTLKVRLIGTIVATLVFLLSAIELLGPVTHLLPEPACPPLTPRLWQASWVHYSLASLLFATAMLTIWHHGRLHEKARRYKNLVAFVMVLSGKISELKSQNFSQQAAVSILDALVRALDRDKSRSGIRGLINASILTQSPGLDGGFNIYAQDSMNTFKADLIVPEDCTVAGRVLEINKKYRTGGALMYVPSTNFVHGIALRAGKTGDEGEVFVETEIVPTSYTVLDEAAERDAIKCLLCIQIPGVQQQRWNNRSYTSAVLSLSGRKRDCMDSVFFTGAKLASSLLAEFMW